MITSGFLKALQDKGIEDIAELKYTDRKALSLILRPDGEQYANHHRKSLSRRSHILPTIHGKKFLPLKGASGWPVLHRAQYSKANLYVLTIPDNFSDLYQYPPEVLNRIRSIVSADLQCQARRPFTGKPVLL